MNWPQVTKSMRPHAAIAVVVTIYILLAMAYAWRVPIMEGADELHHAAYIEHIVQTHTLPEIGGGNWEAVQPPLYYLIAASVVVVSGSPQLVPETIQTNPEFSWDEPSPAGMMDPAS